MDLVQVPNVRPRQLARRIREYEEGSGRDLFYMIPESSWQNLR